MSNSLNTFIKQLNEHWGELSSDLTLTSKQLLEQLCKDCINDDWIKQLLIDKPAAKTIYKDPKHGFILNAHVEQAGEQSPPHDHGDGWVLYAMVTGDVAMGIYHKTFTQDGDVRLVQKDLYHLTAGQCSVYLPGDIHDTTTMENNSIMLRLTSCDFHKEVAEGRLTRYTDNVTKWS